MDIADLGTLTLCVALVLCAYAFATSVMAGAGRPHLLVAARWGVFATCGLVVFATLLLAYAFQTHDFSIRYVYRYSDRSMHWSYLLTCLWGGQDGSLLWWSFLLCGYTAACTAWMKVRYLALQPYVLATLMSILGFFLLLMLFAANPFAVKAGLLAPDGEGLNPLLQNYWMVIHPPSLYMGFVGWSVPFAFVIAALITGRLNEEWMVAARKWSLVAWGFLSLGLTLGMLWSYEELGWGGYWAWDPVENASFHPWLVGTAYLHSVLVQERYSMLKIWNVFLLCLTFFMTIFGTFLTRSGLIASVHSFARSDIGIWFVWYMVLIVVVCTALVVWRLPKLRARHRIENLLSREFAFLLNNWMFLGIMVFVVIATTFPLLTEWLRGEEVTVGPPFYNTWMVPTGLALLVLLGVGPLISWRKATGKNLAKAFRWPLVATAVVGLSHRFLGEHVGLPGPLPLPLKESYTLQDHFFAYAPLISSTTCAFVLATIAQEFWRGTAVRMRKGEGVFTALYNLVGRAKRRYGGYIVHTGIVLMYLGWTGAAYDIEKEGVVSPGGIMSVGKYQVRYDAPRYEQDANKRMQFVDLTLLNAAGEPQQRISPAKYLYRTSPDMPTTEVAINSGPIEDLYVILSTIDNASGRATLRVVIRPLVFWIWAGGIVLLFGVLIAVSPSMKELLVASEESDLERLKRQKMPGLIGATAIAVLLGLFALWPLLNHGRVLVSPKDAASAVSSASSPYAALHHGIDRRSSHSSSVAHLGGEGR